ncbi:MAG: hypothetical protein WAU58_17260 [Terriglobales bacterium]|jgi:hypothetical protein
MPIAVLIPAVFGIAFVFVILLTTVYAPRVHDVDHVILLARKLDPSDLETLLDAGEEWRLRQSLTAAAFREAQEERILLAREYLRRMAHNTGLIQLWVMWEKQQLEARKCEDGTERNSLLAEAAQLALELRIYSMVTGFKIWLWVAFRAHLWPGVLIPGVTTLRVQCGVNVIEKYRRLTGLAVALGARYGRANHDRLLEAL